MPKPMILEEFHLTLLAPSQLQDREAVAAGRTLRAVKFQRTLRTAIRGLIRGNQNLDSCVSSCPGDRVFAVHILGEPPV
jgi:hypothetical protein